MSQTPIGYQIGGTAVFCSDTCLTPPIARILLDALSGFTGSESDLLGDVHPWTVDLYAGDDPLRCDHCRRVLVQPPSSSDLDESESDGSTQSDPEPPLLPGGHHEA